MLLALGVGVAAKKANSCLAFGLHYVQFGLEPALPQGMNEDRAIGAGGGVDRHFWQNASVQTAADAAQIA